MLRVNEIFHSVQGEGQNVGLNTIFLRLSGCNLQCEWCDTKYHKDAKEMSATEVAKEIMMYPSLNLTITGGEPLIQQKELISLGQLVNHIFSVETNGTIIPDKKLSKRVSYWAVSPKLGNSDAGSLLIRINYDALEAFNKEKAIFKFVVNNLDDIKEIQFLQDQIQIPASRIYLMPEGTDPKTLNEKSIWLVEQCKKFGYNFSPRVQVLIWGPKRGV